jgi:hypothetical protein
VVVALVVALDVGVGSIVAVAVASIVGVGVGHLPGIGTQPPVTQAILPSTSLQAAGGTISVLQLTKSLARPAGHQQ